MINLEIGFDQADDVFRQLLLDTYDTVMYCNNDGYTQHPEDIAHNAEILHAVSVLMDYVSVGNTGQKALEAIHDKYRYRNIMSKMNDQ